MARNLLSASAFVALMVICVESAQSGDNPVKSGLFGEEMALVTATVVSVADVGQIIACEIRIDYVYWGPKRLAGQRVKMRVAKRVGEGSRHFVFPPLAVNETGIWAVKLTPDGPVVYFGGMYATEFPTRKGVDGEFAEVKAWAETIEKLSKLNRADRVKELKTLSSSVARRVSVWAIAALADGEGPDAIDFFHELLEQERLPIVAQVAIDEALMKIDRTKWQKSPNRSRVIGRWVRGKLSSGDATTAFRRLDALAQHRDNEATGSRELLQLLRLGATNPEIPLDVRRNACWSMRWYSGRYTPNADEMAAFNVLIDIAGNAKEPEIRYQASRVLLKEYTLDAERRRIVGELRGSTKDKNVAEALEELLKSSIR